MTTTIIKSVGSGKDYETLSAFFTALAASQDDMNADLVSSDTIVIAELYGRVKENDNTVSSSFTTSSSNYIHIRPAPGTGHHGHWRYGSGLVSTDQCPFALEIDGHVYVERIVFEGAGALSERLVDVTVSNITFDRCFFVISDSSVTASGLVKVSSTNSTASVAYFVSCVFCCGKVKTSAPLLVDTTASSSYSAYATLQGCTIAGSTVGCINVTTDSEDAEAYLTSSLVAGCSGTYYSSSTTGAGTPTFNGAGNVDDVGGVSGATFSQRTLNQIQFLCTDIESQDYRVSTSSVVHDLGAEPTLPSFPSILRYIDINGSYRGDSSLSGQDPTFWAAGASAKETNNIFLSSPTKTGDDQNLVRLPRGAEYDSTKRNVLNPLKRELDEVVTAIEDDVNTQSTSATALLSNSLFQKENLCPNPVFSYWTLGTTFTSMTARYTADGWYKNSSASVTRVSENSATVALYALRLKTLSGGTTAYVEARIPTTGNWTSSKVTVRAKTSTTKSNTARIGIGTSSLTYSSYHTGSGSFEELISTYTLSSSESAGTWTADNELIVRLEITSPSSTADYADFTEVMVCFGEFQSLVFIPTEFFLENDETNSRFQLYDSWYTFTSGITASTQVEVPVLIPNGMYVTSDEKFGPSFEESTSEVENNSGITNWDLSIFNNVTAVEEQGTFIRTRITPSEDISSDGNLLVSSLEVSKETQP